MQAQPLNYSRCAAIYGTAIDGCLLWIARDPLHSFHLESSSFTWIVKNEIRLMNKIYEKNIDFFPLNSIQKWELVIFSFFSSFFFFFNFLPWFVCLIRCKVLTEFIKYFFTNSFCECNKVQHISQETLVATLMIYPIRKLTKIF